MRFLLFISYVGTQFRGVQRRVLPNHKADTLSIQSIVECGLSKLNPTNEPRVVFSSRTDAGVHALCNTAHVDLNLYQKGQFFDTDYITCKLNKYFNDGNFEIRVKQTRCVSPDFHARFCAVGRSYLYRIGVLKESVEKRLLTSTSPTFLSRLCPLVELHRIFLVRSPFETELFKEGLSLLVGCHDFASFMAHSKKFNRSTVRELKEAYIVPGRPLIDSALDALYDNLILYDVYFHGTSFLYKQVCD